jgi:hypothetical protein
MDAAEFTTRLTSLSGSEIVDVARWLRHELDSADGELAWWKATLAVTGTLRRTRQTRQAGMAAHHASVAVQRAAARDGILEIERDAVTLVARAASEAARALVARPDGAPTAVLAPWSALAFAAA